MKWSVIVKFIDLGLARHSWLFEEIWYLIIWQRNIQGMIIVLLSTLAGLGHFTKLGYAFKQQVVIV